MTIESNEPLWLTKARAAIGTREVAGDSDNPEILAFYRDAGYPEIKHDEVPWCAAFAGAMLERSGVPSAKTLSARDYLTWGKPIDKPKPGCICVFSRGDPRGWQGHVGFYVGEEGDNISLLAGNQGNKVSIANMPIGSLLGYRWPVTATNSRTYKAVGVGAIGTALTAVAPVAQEVTGVGSELKSIGGGTFAAIGALLTIVAFIAIIYARMSDAKEKGR